MSTPKISIVCAYYNRQDHVTDSVQSLLDQTYDNFEIIIVNDGSTDSTLEKLEQFNDPRLTIVTQKNTGFVGAIIRAVSEAKGDYIAVHGSGDISYPDRISKQAQILSEQANVGVVGCHVEDDSKTGNNVYTLKIPNGLNFNKRLLEHNMFTHGEIMFRKNIYDKVNGYRPFFVYAQDHDLWLRMSEHCDYNIIEEVLYRRFRLDTGVSRNTEKEMLQASLSEFAVYCARQRNNEKQDPLDRIGPQSVFLRTPSERLAIRFIWLAMPHMIAGRHSDGWSIIKRALNEYSSLKVIFIFCIGLTHKQKILWKFIGKPAYKSLYRQHLRRSGQ